MVKFMHLWGEKGQGRRTLLLLTAAILSGSFWSEAQAQQFVTGPYNRTTFDNNFDRFLSSLDSTGLDMADSYNHRNAIAARNNWLNSDAELSNLAYLKHFSDRTLEAQILSINPLNQGIDGVPNQGNNQSNNGYLPGSLFGPSGLNSPPFQTTGLGSGFFGGGFGAGFGGIGNSLFGNNNNPFGPVNSTTAITPTFFPGYGGRVEIQQHTQQLPGASGNLPLSNFSGTTSTSSSSSFSSH